MPTPARQLNALDEVVYDSEPERAEIRRRLRKAESKSLSTDSSEDLRPMFEIQNAGRDNDVIEISDSDSELDRQSSRRLTKLDYHHTVHGSFSSNAIPSSSRILTDSSFSNHVNDNLKRFAFVGSTSTNDSTLRKGSTSSVLPSRNKGVPSSHIKPSPFDLANLDLAKLSRCVSCELDWTSRKTAIRKKIHIESCAKKKALNEETIWTLVQTEISKQTPQIKGGQGKKTKEGVITRPNTLLEDVVVEAAPKKKVKRQQAASRLTTVSSTRDMILAKAQTILSVSPLSAPYRQGVAPLSNGSDDELPPPTLSFAPSGLAQLQGTATRTLFTDSDPSWQHTDIWGSHSFDGACKVDENVRPYVTETKVKDSLHVELSEGNGVSEVVLRSPTDSVDNASSPNMNSLKKDKKTKTRLPPCDLSVVETTDGLQATPTTKKGTEGTRSRSSKKDVKRANKFGDDWENHMKWHIVQNIDLHHRVLRYEPVHFNIFMDLATLYAPSSSRLKSHLRGFLDRHAIHFYEGQTWKR